MRPLTNVAASVHQRLKNQARANGDRFNDLLQHYALERFLRRLAASPYRDRLVLKGALMLRVWDVAATRPTRDIDLLGRIENQPARVSALVAEICQAAVEPDGMAFDPESIATSPIADEAEYNGIRATFEGSLGTARIPMQIDFGFGDRVTPGPVDIEYPSVLGASPTRLLGYTPETSIAEKFHVMLHRGTLNSRMKDFFDIWALSDARSFEGRVLSEAIRATCEQRGAVVPRVISSLEAEALRDPHKDIQWKAFRRRLDATKAPATFAEVGALVAGFLQPVFEAVAEDATFSWTWRPGGPWRPSD